MEFVKKNIPEKSDIISYKIKPHKYTNNSPTNYALNTSFFDPSQSSPPNDFMLKLNKRMECYMSLGTNDNKLVNA
jgi:hypothetical protein